MTVTSQACAVMKQAWWKCLPWEFPGFQQWATQQLEAPVSLEGRSCPVWPGHAEPSGVLETESIVMPQLCPELASLSLLAGIILGFMWA